MDLLIVHFTLSLFLFRAVNSERSELSNISKEVSNIINMKEYAYDNVTMFSPYLQYQETTRSLERMRTQNIRLHFGKEMLQCSVEISKLKLNTSSQVTKMMGDIEEVRYLMMQSLKKENKLFNERNPQKNTDVEEFFHLEAHERLTQEYTLCLIQLKTLKYWIYDWNAQKNFGYKASDDVDTALNNFIHNEDISELPPNHINNEEPSPRFDEDAEIDELERLQRFVLMIKDQLVEMPKPAHRDQEDDAKLETDSQNEFHEKVEVPRWLLTERDVEEIRTKYIMWIRILEDIQNPAIERLREKLRSIGYNLKFFCKTLAEYFNLTSILLECTTKEDTECLDMITDIFAEERFKKFIPIFAEWHGLEHPFFPQTHTS